MSPSPRASRFPGGLSSSPPASEQRIAACSRLGARFNAKGTVETGSCEVTNVPGLYVAGDASKDGSVVIVGGRRGYEAGMAINQGLLRKTSLRGGTTLTAEGLGSKSRVKSAPCPAGRLGDHGAMAGYSKRTLVERSSASKPSTRVVALSALRRTHCVRRIPRLQSSFQAHGSFGFIHKFARTRDALAPIFTGGPGAHR